MTAPGQESASSERLDAFASRVAALDAGAWERIALRCGALNESSLGALFGRAGLLAESATPDVDPYQQLWLKPAMAALGAAVGLLLELTKTLPPDPPRRPSDSRGGSQQPPGYAAFLEIERAARRQLPKHPGIAAALHAAFMALVVGPMMSPQRLAAIYAPFEPEIPFESLGAPAGHTA